MYKNLFLCDKETNDHDVGDVCLLLKERRNVLMFLGCADGFSFLVLIDVD
jgi:hypothetical protein